jgi:LAO/AO transport system kinase
MKTDLAKQILKGHLPSIARAISLIENEDPRGDTIHSRLWNYRKNAIRIGITGPPGAGKSTLTSRLTLYLLEHFKKIAIIAVDPSSPFTGGAILGDRIRMPELVNSENVFIRSMATRGSLGGLAKKSNQVADVLDAAGYQCIIFETVGVGQTELDIAREADATVVVLVPESGDGIQAMKAGLMEIADLFVVNKSDREGSFRLAVELEMMLKNRHTDSQWNIPVLKTVAHLNQGVDELARKIMEFVDFAKKHDILRERRRQRIQNQFIHLLKEKLFENMKLKISDDKINELIVQIVNNEISLTEAVQILLNQ